ncbi:MAG: hypothetical protein ACTHNP_01845 [Solirubrobacterales bacterium]
MPKQPSETVEKLRRTIDERISEIDDEINALDEEREQLQGARNQLPGRGAKRSPGRPRKSPRSPSRTNGARPRKRRKRRGGTRADQALKVIEGSPGIGASGVAKVLKIKPNYLYRVLGDLEKEGRVKKDGRKYFPA